MCVCGGGRRSSLPACACARRGHFSLGRPWGRTRRPVCPISVCACASVRACLCVCARAHGVCARGTAAGTVLATECNRSRGARLHRQVRRCAWCVRARLCERARETECVRAHTHTHTHARARTHTHTHAHTRAHTHRDGAPQPRAARTRTCVCVRAHTHVCAHARTHTHTHNQRGPRAASRAIATR